MINQAPIVRYTASVSEKFFPNSWRKTFSAESNIMCDPEPTLYPLERLERVERLERTDPCDERTGAIEPFDRTPTSDF